MNYKAGLKNSTPRIRLGFKQTVSLQKGGSVQDSQSGQANKSKGRGKGSGQ